MVPGVRTTQRLEGATRRRAGGSRLSRHRRREALGLDVSDVTQQWRELCLSSDEFAEVRNAWSTSLVTRPAVPSD